MRSRIEARGIEDHDGFKNCKEELFLLQNLERIIRVEWIAQELKQRFEKFGPLIEPVINIIPDDFPIEEEDSNSYNYLIIQGSFDPPTSSHIELLSKAIKLRSDINPSDKNKIILLLSLSHVDKKLNVLNRSLLGYRVEMLEDLFSSLKLKTPITIGLSNVARYIDLIDAAHQSYTNIRSLTFIMGMDVFKKLLDPSYYSKSLEQVFPLIFRADYFIAGREDVFSEEDFVLFLNSQLSSEYHKNIHFLSTPKSYRFLNATSIREKYSKKQPSQEAYTHSAIRKYLENNNIYRLTSKWIATKIAIQSIVQLALEAGKDQIIATEILRQLLPEIISDIQLQQQLITEYRTEKNTQITERWTQLINLLL